MSFPKLRFERGITPYDLRIRLPNYTCRLIPQQEPYSAVAILDPAQCPKETPYGNIRWLSRFYGVDPSLCRHRDPTHPEICHISLFPWTMLPVPYQAIMVLAHNTTITRMSIGRANEPTLSLTIRTPWRIDTYGIGDVLLSLIEIQNALFMDDVRVTSLRAGKSRSVGGMKETSCTLGLEPRHQWPWPIPPLPKKRVYLASAPE